MFLPSVLDVVFPFQVIHSLLVVTTEIGALCDWWSVRNRKGCTDCFVALISVALDCLSVQ